MDNDNIVCAQCGHRAENHLDLFGFQMGCDIELSWGDGIQLCGCDDFMPVQVGSGAEVN